MSKSNSIQMFCKKFRVEILGLTREQMESLTGTNKTTISAFERGDSNNINHLYTYLSICQSPEQIVKFKSGLIKSMIEGNINV